MGKKVKLSKMLKLATTPSNCEVLAAAYGGYSRVLKDAGTIANAYLDSAEFDITPKVTRDLLVKNCLSSWEDEITIPEQYWLVTGSLAQRVVTATGKSPVREKVSADIVHGIINARLQMYQEGSPMSPEVPILNWVSASSAIGSWLLHGSNTYMVAPELMELLLQTKLHKYPVKELRMPYDVVEFAIPRSVYANTWVTDATTPEKDTGVSVVLSGGKGVEENHIGVVDLRVARRGVDGALLSTCPGSLTINCNTNDDVVTQANECSQTVVDEGGSPDCLDGMVKMSNTVAALLIYVTLPDADDILCAESPAYKEWITALKRKKKINKKDRQRMSIPVSDRRRILGNSIKILDRHDYSADDDDDLTKTSGPTRKSPVTHWRQGHMKSVRVGPRSGPQTLEPRWIKPTVVAAPHPGAVPQPKKTVMR